MCSKHDSGSAGPGDCKLLPLQTHGGPPPHLTPDTRLNNSSYVMCSRRPRASRRLSASDAGRPRRARQPNASARAPRPPPACAAVQRWPRKPPQMASGRSSLLAASATPRWVPPRTSRRLRRPFRRRRRRALAEKEPRQLRAALRLSRRERPIWSSHSRQISQPWRPATEQHGRRRE